MDIERLRIFVTVADCLNFTKAAERLYISQPTLSRHISDLEENLQVKLFERTTRKVSLTDAGKLFLNEARQIINRYDSLMDRASLLGNGVSGSLRVGYLELFTQNIIPPAVRSFRTKFPLVNLRLKEVTHVGGLPALRDGTLDMCFVISRTLQPTRHEDFNFRRIYTGSIEMIVSNHHPYAGYEIVSPQILKDEQILTFDPEETPELRREVTKMCMQYGFLPKFVSESYSPGAIFLMVQSGMGVSLLSSLITSVLRTEERFHSMRLEGVHFPSNLELAWRKNDTNMCIPNFLREVELAAHPNTPDNKIDLGSE